MFNRKIPAMVDMNLRSLASDDGSRQAAGRGSGQDDLRALSTSMLRQTPYMSNAFWPLERRLDTAVFRALFASSVRTARQFCIHGHVKVNGKKVRWYPHHAQHWSLLTVVLVDEIPGLSSQPWRHVQR